jgi:excisionase family DNA binding protein
MSTTTAKPDAVAEVYSPAELADLLRVSVSLLERWRAAGDGPRFVRLGRRVLRYRKADVDAWLLERAAPA